MRRVRQHGDVIRNELTAETPTVSASAEAIVREDSILGMGRRRPSAGRARAALTILAALTAAGCVGGDPAGGTAGDVAVAVETVAGVERLTVSGTPPVWRLESMAAIGRQGGMTNEPAPDEFGRIIGVVADEEGNVYVADQMTHELRVFDAAGRFVRRLGGEGGGPGEIRRLNGVGWLAGDTLLVFDAGNARLMRLTRGGAHVGQWPAVAASGPIRFVLNGGPREAYVVAFRPRAGARGVERLWVRVTPEGPGDSLVAPVEPARGSAFECEREGSIGFFPNPYAERLIAAPAPGGERVVARSTAYRLAFVSPPGDTIRVLRRDVTLEQIPDFAWAAIEMDYRKWRNEWQGARCTGALERPPAGPTLRSVFFDHDGRMMVEYETGGRTRFDVYDRKWRPEGTFDAPDGLDTGVAPYLRDSRLYAVIRDSLDVHQVRSYRLTVPET